MPNRIHDVFATIPTTTPNWLDPRAEAGKPDNDDAVDILQHGKRLQMAENSPHAAFAARLHAGQLELPGFLEIPHFASDPGRVLLLGILQNRWRRVPFEPQWLWERVGFLEQAYKLIAPLVSHAHEGHLKALKEKTEELSFHLKNLETSFAAWMVYEAQTHLRKALLEILGINMAAIHDRAGSMGPEDEPNPNWVISPEVYLLNKHINEELAPHHDVLSILNKILFHDRREPITPETIVYPIYHTQPPRPVLFDAVATEDELLLLINRYGFMPGKHGAWLHIRLAKDNPIDLPQALHKAMDLPSPKERGLLRMPERDAFRNVAIEDARGNLLICFDNQGCLVKAPSQGPTQQTEIPDSWNQTATMPEKIDIHDVVIVGAGPAGIGTAAELMSRGIFNLVLLEGGKQALHRIKELYPAGKDVIREYKKIRTEGKGIFAVANRSSDDEYYRRVKSIQGFYHLPLQTEEMIMDVMRKKNLWFARTRKGKIFATRNLVMAIGGTNKPRQIEELEKISDHDLAQRVMFASSEALEIYKSTVAINGGSDTAFDMVMGAIKNGNQVCLIYRGEDLSKNLTPAKIQLLQQFVAEGRLIMHLGKNVQGVEWAPLGSQIKITFKEGGATEVDRLITALGYEPETPPALLNNAGFGKISINEKGQVFDGAGNIISGLYAPGDTKKTRAIQPALNEAAWTAEAIYTQLVLKPSQERAEEPTEPPADCAATPATEGGLVSDVSRMLLLNGGFAFGGGILLTALAVL